MSDDEVAEVTRITPVHYIVGNCPYCGDLHRHGNIGEIEKPGDDGGHRVSECFSGGYRLVATENTTWEVAADE